MPASREVRLFKSNFLESMTHVHPVIPALLWFPFIGYLLYLEILKGHTLGSWATYSFLGLAVWTLTEYVLHRFIFHFTVKSALGKWLIFAFHGLHHEDPQSPTRLVMPPVPAIIYILILYMIFSLLAGGEYLNLFFSFFLLGYLAYDYIHFYTHHGKGKTKIGKFLKSYHLDHHFNDHHKKYGVSSPIWDYIFRTR